MEYKLLPGLLLGAALIASLGCVDGDQVACTADAKLCPDGSYVGRNPALNCEFNPCPETGCVQEGGTIPVVQDPPECCAGLELIPPKEEQILGISGICTSKCGNGACDSETESVYNCPQDCSAEASGPEVFDSESDAFNALEEELDRMQDLSEEDLESLLGN